MVNGSAGPTAELHQGDPFKQDLFQEDQPKELKEEEPAAVCNQQKEHSDQKENEGVNDREEEEEKEEESPEEEKLKPDPLDDLYTSLASSEMYNNVSTLTKPQENAIRVINTLALLISPFIGGKKPQRLFFSFYCVNLTTPQKYLIYFWCDHSFHS